MYDVLAFFASSNPKSAKVKGRCYTEVLLHTGK